MAEDEGAQIANSNGHKKKKKQPLLSAISRGNIPPHLLLYFWYCIQKSLNYKTMYELQNHTFCRFLLLMNPVCSCSVVLFISLFFVTCLPLLCQISLHCLYDSFHVFCFHHNIYVSALLLPSIIDIIFVFIYYIVMRITLTLWHRVILILCLKLSSQHYTTSTRGKILVLGNNFYLLHYGVH